MISIPLASPAAGRFAALGHVEAGAEHRALAADHHHPIIGRDRCAQRVDHLAQKLAIERVALLRPVHPDGLYRTALLDDDLVHDAPLDVIPARCRLP